MRGLMLRRGGVGVGRGMGLGSGIGTGIGGGEMARHR